MSIRSQSAAPGSALSTTTIAGFDQLTELAMDMRWTWNHATDEVWRALEPALWDLSHHPCDVLQAVPQEKLRRSMADPNFRKKVEKLVQSQKQATDAPAWFQQKHAQAPLSCVAYFSMEFMLSEALPIYSGGLGNVAGDQLKAASDLGVPAVGVGLLYQQGYFRQVIDKDGAQQALYPHNDPAKLPITPLRQANGELLRLGIALPGYRIFDPIAPPLLTRKPRDVPAQIAKRAYERYERRGHRQGSAVQDWLAAEKAVRKEKP